MSDDIVPPEVDLGTDLAADEEYDILDSSLGSQSVGELTRQIINGPKQDRDVDITNPTKPVVDPLAEYDSDDDEEIESEPVEQEAVAEQKPAETPPAPQTLADDALWSALEANTGFSLRDKYTSPTEAIKGLANAQRALSQRDDYAYWGKQLQENPEAVLSALQERLQKKPEAPAPVQEAAPQYDPAWNNWIDPATQEWKPNTPEAVIRDATKFQEHRKKQLIRDAVKDDLESVKKEIAERDKKIEEMRQLLLEREQREQQTVAQQRHFQELHTHLKPNAQWIFKNGTSGELTEHGQLLEQNLKELSTKIVDPAALAEAALNKTIMLVAQKQPVASGKSTNKAEQAVRSEQLAARPAGQKRATGRDPWRNKTPSKADLAAELRKFLPS